jgi:exodeoxyribonuclease VII large subunit
VPPTDGRRRRRHPATPPDQYLLPFANAESLAGDPGSSYNLTDIPPTGRTTPAGAPEQRERGMYIWGVGEVNRYLKQLIEGDPSLRELWVEGEVSNLSVAMSGHAYFTLKDAGSQLRCVMWRQSYGRMRHRPNNGDRCVARGPIRVYEPQGAYQLAVEFLAPAGLGERQLRLEELRARLEAEGLFEPSRKRPLPSWPVRVGVVTSATGAVIHDIFTVVARRFPLADLVLAPTPVQGDGAAAQICAAIADVAERGRVDVIILARGGGSTEDLWPFNEEMVARAIFASPIPVVSAIGHETDVTIADLVADYRAPTPSAAAEVVVPDWRDLVGRVEDLARALEWHARRGLAECTARVEQANEELDRYAPASVVAARDEQVVQLAHRVVLATRHQLALQAERVRAPAAALAALDPGAILRRGYSLAWRADSGEAITRVEQVEPGVVVRTQVSNGRLDSVVIRSTDRQEGRKHVNGRAGA